jgi:hypothetical protein
MIRSYSRTSILIFIILLSICGCTGTRVIVKPELSTIKPPTTKGCGKIAVTEINTDGSTSKIPSGLVLEFAKHLEKSGLFDEVYCPVRDSDKFNLSLDAKFDGKLKTNGGANHLRSAIVGLSLFLFEPFVWYEFNFDLTGHVDVKREGQIVASINSDTKVDLHQKFFSTGDEAFQKEVWPASVKATFAQLTRDIEAYCKNNTGEPQITSGVSNNSAREGR